MFKIKCGELFSLLLLVISVVLIGWANYNINLEYGVIALIILNLSLLVNVCTNFSDKIGIAFFYVCIFTFLSGGIIVPYLFHDSDWKGIFTDSENIVIYNCLFISCVMLIIGYVFCRKVKFSFVKGGLRVFSFMEDDRYDMERLKLWNFRIFLLSTMVIIVAEFNRMLYVRLHGYMAMYFGANLSSLATRMSIVSKATLLIGLATKPKKKRLIQYIVLGMAVPFLNFMEGTRSGVMSYFIFVVFYIYNYGEFHIAFFNNKSNRKKFIKFLICMLIALVIIIPILYVWGDLRNASSDGYQTKSTFESIISFFSGMGQSYKLIGYAVRYKGQLPGICYTFGGWIDRILGNSYEAFSVEAATKTNSFGTIMSYITIGYGYLVLHYGTGSSYIAEIYYDFGYMGLVILNFFLGYIFGILSKNKTTSVMKRSVLYMFFYFSITMPRAAFLTPFNQIISMSTIAAYIVVFGLSRKKKILRFGLSKYVRSL